MGGAFSTGHASRRRIANAEREGTSMTAQLVRLRTYALAAVACACVAPGAAMAAAGGDNNRGDFWVDNVGQPPGPGHEMDPHLACADINVWGDKMADAGGAYRIDGWPPSGQKAKAYASNWTYAAGQGGDQVMDVIDVKTLIANAVANGDAPINKQGFHFKIALSQDPHKFKTFWVDCKLPDKPVDTPQGPQQGSPTPASSPAPGSPSASAPAAAKQGVLAVRTVGTGHRPHRAHKRHRHHKRHHRVSARQVRPAFTG